MKNRNVLLAGVILAVCLIAGTLMLFLGYRVTKPEIEEAEFPYSITYEYKGETTTVTGMYHCEADYGPKYWRESNVNWYGYIVDYVNGQESLYLVDETENSVLGLHLNIHPGNLMGDPACASERNAPTGEYYRYEDSEDIQITDSEELEELGFRIVSFTYPEPIENTFKPGVIMLSGEACFYLSGIALLGWLACLILVRRDKASPYGVPERISFALNFPVMLGFFPLVLLTGMAGDMFSVTFWTDTVMYLVPALTVMSVAASLVLRRIGFGKASLAVQLAGPLALAVVFIGEMLA